MSTAPIATLITIFPEALRRVIDRKSRLKGRQPDDAVRAEVLALLGEGPHPREC